MTDPDRGTIRQFLLGLADGMTASGESTTQVQAILTEVATAYGVTDAGFVVLPTAIVVQTGVGSDARVTVSSNPGARLRFDQIAALYGLIREARDGSVEPADGIERLNEIGAARPRLGWIIRTLGHGIMTLGLVLLLLPTPTGAMIAFGLGLLVGLLKLVRSATLELVFPIVAAFASALVVLSLAQIWSIPDPLPVLIAPLITFLPGGLLTTGTVELAAGQMISGSSRLVMGLVQMALLAFGILAAAAVLGVTSFISRPTDDNLTAWWVPLIGLALFCVGNFLHFSAPTRAFGWVLLVLVVAFAGQQVGALLFGAVLGGFVGAVLMTPLVLWIDTLRGGTPSQITFLPAFWLLVPGAAGVIGLTQAVGGVGFKDFASALASVMSVALGVLIGTAIYRTARYGVTELSKFQIRIPTADDDGEERKPFWSRIIRRRN